MTKIKVVTLEQEEVWRDILSGFSKSDVYYTPEYVKAFYQNGDGTPILLYFSYGDVKAVNVVMKRPVPVVSEDKKEELGRYWDYVTPYGYGGFLKEGEFSEEDDRELLESYEKHCRDNDIVGEFVRFHPVLNNAVSAPSCYEVVALGNTVCMSLDTPSLIWENCSSKNRNMIRKAQKSGVQIFWGRDEALFEEFEHIYNATMDKVNAGNYYYFKKEFYQSILEDLKYQSMIFYAKLGEEIIGMSIIMYDGNALHYHLSASKREYLSYAPTNLLLYEAACWGNRIGAKTFHLGGGLGSRQDALYHFKKQFNRQEDCVFQVGRGIFNKEIYEQLCTVNKVDRETGFFPAYRDIK